MSRLHRLTSGLCTVAVHELIAGVEARGQRFKGVRTVNNKKLFVFTDKAGVEYVYAAALVRQR